MSSNFLVVLTLLLALGSGLIAGVFFAFSTFIMRALARLPANEGIAAMQSINVVVLNPWFLGVFFGTAVLSVTAAVIALFQWERPGVAYILAGSALYLIGTFLVTVVCNVPRNESLALVNATNPAGATAWTTYVRDWTFWNHVRTVAALAASASFILALAH